jgi:hypothetical protein
MKQLPADIREAVDLLKVFERTEDYYAKPELFIEAMEILELHLKHNPGSEHCDYIRNIRKSYAKVFVRQLGQLPEDAFQDEILNYTQALNEVKNILDEKEDYEIYSIFMEFIDMWKEEMENPVKPREKKVKDRSTEYDINPIFND